jgi:hypothetical protein
MIDLDLPKEELRAAAAEQNLKHGQHPDTHESHD